MTVNEQHVMMAEVAMQVARELQSDLGSILEVLSSGPAPKRDPDAVNLTRALMTLSQTLATAQAHASTAERKLRYGRTRAAGCAAGASDDSDD